MRTLLVDSSFYPVTIINWQRAMVLLFSGRAEVVQNYDEIKIRSVKDSYNLPKVMRLITNIKRHIEVKFSRFNVYWRDSWTCQYCLNKPPKDLLTFDHVIPRSRGGGTTWENVVTCCRDCNSKKGDTLLENTNMRLNKEAVKPRWVPQLHLKVGINDPEEWTHFIPEKLYKTG